MLIFFLCGEFLLHIPCSPHIYLGGLCYKSRAGSFFIFIWGVSLTHPMLASFLSGEFLLRIPWWLSFSVGSFSYTSRARFTFIWGVSLTHPMLTSFLLGKFLLRIPCWLNFCLRSFSLKKTKKNVLVSHLSGVSLTHPSFSYTSHADLFLCGKFFLHIPCCTPFYVGSLCYTSRAGFFFHFYRGCFS